MIILGAIVTIAAIVCIALMWMISVKTVMHDSAEEWANDYIDREIDRLVETAQLRVNVRFVWEDDEIGC